jgi:CO/xanthine dehydrogenase FAD-binding subunit
MDVNTVTGFRRPTGRADLRLAAGETFLGGGSWLFSEPQPAVTGLVDLQSLGWEPVERTPTGLRVAATCSLAELASLRRDGWDVPALFHESCRALLGSFKVWNVATVGGNLCLALPAGPMAALVVALDAALEIWRADGSTEAMDALDLITGPGRTSLGRGDVLRAVDFGAGALSGETASRKASLRPLGRSAAFLAARYDSDGRFTVAVTAATPRPHRFRFASLPRPDELRAAIDTIPTWHDDPHGSPDWRRATTLRLAEELRGELAGRTAA